ncbi:hypothetical protein D3C85_1734760 [compost metagenome]
MVEGKLQKEGEVIHVVVKQCYDLSGLLQGLVATEAENTGSASKKMVQTELFPEARNFK